MRSLAILRFVLHAALAASLVGGCARNISVLTLRAKHTTPESPKLTVPVTIIAGAAGVTATVAQPIDGLIYDWTLINATLISTSRGPSVSFTAGSAGIIIYTVNVSNDVGVTAAPANASSAVVAGLPGDYTPLIVAPWRVIAGRSGS